MGFSYSIPSRNYQGMCVLITASPFLSKSERVGGMKRKKKTDLKLKASSPRVMALSNNMSVFSSSVCLIWLALD